MSDLEDEFDPMIVNRPLYLDQQLRKCLVQIDNQMEEIRQEAVRTQTPPVKMRDSNGDRIWAPLVEAKARVLTALAQMEAIKEKP